MSFLLFIFILILNLFNINVEFDVDIDNIILQLMKNCISITLANTYLILLISTLRD